ncbi:MAG: transglutaminase domain-containing protein [Chloroflexi bacterium]|nr:transglutaminase domain-containing protein [Chloroflexota bacterium]
MGRAKLLLVLAWVLFVLYPNPMLLAVTLWHSLSPPVDVEAARPLAERLPNDPEKVRDLVLSELVIYEYDWNVYGVPWYFPSTKEVIRDGRGDCESQAVLLSSILYAKNIPHQLKISFDHIWVKYEGKVANEIEHDSSAFIERTDKGFEVKLPEHFDLERYIRVQTDARWHPMPAERKVLLFLGPIMILFGPWLVVFAQRVPALARVIRYTRADRRVWRTVVASRRSPK